MHCHNLSAIHNMLVRHRYTCPLIKWIIWQHNKMCTQITSVDSRYVPCSDAFISLGFLSLFLYLFVPLAPIAAVHIPMPLLPAIINEKAGNLSWSKCVIICWLPDQLLLYRSGSDPSQVDSCTSSLFFFLSKLTLWFSREWQSEWECNW